MGGTDRRMPLERHVVDGLEYLRGAGERPVDVARRDWRDGRRGGRAAHVVEEIFGRRERRDRRLLPVHLQLTRRSNRLLFALADDGHVVALADHSHEARDPANRRFVDAEELRAGNRRLHVARVKHARQLHADGPLERAVDLRRDVEAPRRLADHPELLDGLDLRDAGRRIDVLAGQRDVESLPADQFAIRHAPRRVVPDRDDAVADGEAIGRHAKSRRRHLQQHAPCLGRDAPHRPAVGLQRVRAARAALIDGDVGPPHHDGGLVVRDIELVRHDLPECRAGSLTEIGLADVERRGVVAADDDPRVELSEVGIGVRARVLNRRDIGQRYGAGADHEEAGSLEEIPSRRRGHDAISFAARLIAAWMR